MRRKLPPFVECWRDRHGRLRVYFRRDRGRRIALPTTIASEEFNAAYQSALSEESFYSSCAASASNRL
jgi:enterobacteria phage integrase